MAKYTHYYDSDTDWQSYAAAHGYSLRSAPYPPVAIDVSSDREAQKLSEAEWEAQHRLRDVGYKSHSTRFGTRDGAHIWAKVCRSTRVPSSAKLPLIFVTHGGGWIQGTAVTEEAWLLWPLLQEFDVVTVSIEYRLAPEHKYPTFMNDCHDALLATVERAEDFGFDPSQIVLAGSSAGGCIALSLGQQARDTKIAVKGVLANVPITCCPQHFPRSQYEYGSYDQCQGTLLSSGEMHEVWNFVLKNPEDGADAVVSPLLGKVEGLPPHAIFVAGQDPLRDEGIAYSEKLKDAGVDVELHVYQGVPHTFAEYAMMLILRHD